MIYDVGELVLYSHDIGQYFKKIPAVIINKFNMGYSVLLCESFDIVLCMPYLIQKI
jgi:hypothetical protein